MVHPMSPVSRVNPKLRFSWQELEIALSEVPRASLYRRLARQIRNSSSGGAALHLGSEYQVRVAAWDFLFELIPDPNLIPPVRPRPIHPAMRIPRGLGSCSGTA